MRKSLSPISSSLLVACGVESGQGDKLGALFGQVLMLNIALKMDLPRKIGIFYDAADRVIEC